jgi:CRISPR/Cas system endoribonuclease Cas6 (RAMP superfamily)
MKEPFLLLHIIWNNIFASCYVQLSYIEFQAYNCTWYSYIYKATPNNQKNAVFKRSSWIAVIIPKQTQWSVMQYFPKANEETCQEVLKSVLQERFEMLSSSDCEGIWNYRVKFFQNNYFILVCILVS